VYTKAQSAEEIILRAVGLNPTEPVKSLVSTFTGLFAI